MFLVMFIYLAMAAPLSGCVNASLSARQGEALVCLRIAGLELMKFTGLFDHETDRGISVEEILSLLKEGKSNGKQRRKRLRSIKRLLFRCARISELNIRGQIGLDEAWNTALAAGSVRAAVYSVLSFLRMAERATVCILPDYSSACFCVHLRCIFSVRAGDLMFSAIKAALQQAAGKEIVHAAASH